MDNFPQAIALACLLWLASFLSFAGTLAYLDRPQIEVVKVKQVPPVLPVPVEVARR